VPVTSPTEEQQHEPEHAGGAQRRRGNTLKQAIFEAVFEQLDTVGYTKLSVKGVAAAAHTGRAALYRRWLSKEELVADALQDALPSPAEVPPHDTLRDDLLALLRCMREAFESKHSAAFHAIQAESGQGADLVRTVVRQRVSDPCRRMILEALRRAADRGEASEHAVSTPVANVGPAMLIYYRLTVTPAIPDDYLETLVDEVILPMVRPEP
jgi:AcrR family transcriptional regulator